MGQGKWWLGLMVSWGLLLWVCQPGFASGFAVNEAGARSSALADAVVARADDLSALFYNPAGITQLPGLQAMAGSAVVIPHTQVVTRLGGATFQNSVNSVAYFLPYFNMAYQVNDRVWLGLGVSSPYGLGTIFDSSWPGRFNIIEAFISTININPTVAVKVTDWLSAAAGLDIMYLNFKMKRALPLPLLGVQETSIKGDSFGYGFNLGLHVKPWDFLAFGVSYRSQVKQAVHGEAKFSPATALNGGASGSLILPDQILGGVMVQPWPNLTLELGVIWINWSLLKNFNLQFNNSLGTLSEPKHWKNTWRGQLGIEYQPLDWLAVRGGYAYEVDAIPEHYADYTVPMVGDRHTFSCGPGFRWSSWALDVAYTFVLIPDKTITTSRAAGVLPNSEFRGRNVHSIGLSLAYKF